MGNHRSAEVIAEIVELQNADCRGEEVARVKSVVSDELIGAAVVLLRAGLHLNQNLTAGAAAVLGHIAGGHDVDLPDGIDAGRSYYRPVGARSSGG